MNIKTILLAVAVFAMCRSIITKVQAFGWYSAKICLTKKTCKQKV